MILIADSGSTKTDWVLINKKKIVNSFQGLGINPYYQSYENIMEILEHDLTPKINPDEIRKIHFYGSGCSTETKCQMLSSAFEKHIKNAEININHDLIGAAKALFGNSEGIACILGTGSNSCHYDGKNIIASAVSLGFILGDEGSGSYLGKSFIINYLKENIPVEIKELFEKEYNYNLENILDAVYNQPKPGKFLASFTKFISENSSNEFMKSLIYSSFRGFFSEQIRKYFKYKEAPISCVGSIAYYFQDFLKEVAHENGVEIQKIIKTPIEGLVEYHRNEEEKF
jgi:glucosamine kinase